ncbi:MAG: phospholipase D-like domain-containing protein [Nocardioidaceae bacterium]
MTFPFSAVRRSIAVALVAALAMAVLVTTGERVAHRATEQPGLSPAATAVLNYTPVTGAVFNRPTGTPGQQRAIFTALNKAINAAPSGSMIQFAVYSFSELPTADALLAAHRRGVNVQLIFDNHHIYPAEAKLRGALGKNTFAKSFVLYCHHSCRGTGGMMHDKLFLFSQSGRATNVVMLGSDNITRHNAIAQWSDMYTVVGDAALYFTYTGVFNQMRVDRPVAHPYITASVDGYTPQFYPNPGVTQATDPIAQILSGITCTGAPVGYGDDAGNTVIRISQHAWNGSRGVYLARMVAALATQGCNVEVIYGIGMGSQVLSILRSAGIPLSAGHHRGIRTHQKLLLVNGMYDGQPSQSVWTGSQNWSNGALNRDDVMLQITGWNAAFGQYISNFNYMWAHG